MNTKGLSLNTIPPLFIPLRFFLTAPLFGVLAALLFLYHGPDIWLSRWNASSLALTHLLTIGFMLMIMIGALFQFIPVMTGQFLPGQKKLAAVIHPLLILGTLALCSGFLYAAGFLYWLAFISLSIAVTLFALSLLYLLASIFDHRLIAFLLRVLFIVLLVTIGLGLYLLLAYAYPESGMAFRQYTDIHALWGLVGWVVLLIMAVSSQVIPMFYVTPQFSVRYLKLLSLSIIVTLMLFSLVKVSADIYAKELFTHLIDIMLSLELIFFTFYTLFLINQRKRKISDVTINFFRLSLISLSIGIAFWWIFSYLMADWKLHYSIQFEFTLAIFLIYGLALSAIIGMLQKIVPFIIYLHLKNLSFKHPGSIAFVPNMKKIISTRSSQVQFILHLLSFVVLITSIYFPFLVRFAGLIMLANFIWLGMTLWQGLIVYKKNQSQILTFPEMKMTF